MPLPLLEIRNATKIYSSSGFMGRNAKSVVALDNFNMTINAEPATITTVAGESGSGKTTLANLMLGFIRLSEGQIIYNGRDVTNMTDEQLKLYRRNVQAVFQDPFGVYNPFYRIDHVFKTVNKHFDLSDNENEFRQMVEEGLNVVGLYGEDVLRKYPHQLSGGQRQRIMMARAYMIKPRLIVADEPVSMVDASLRASILDAMLRLRDEHNISFLYITHDLSTAYQIGDQIYMLYQGTIAERGRTLDVIDRPQHPYVQLLIDSVPVPDPTEKWDVNISLPSEEEMRTAHSKGCRYYPRCPHRMDKCLVAQPPLYQVGANGQEASCYLYDEQPVAPLLDPVVIREDEIAVAGSRRPLVAVIGAILIAGAALALLSSNGQEAVVEDVATEEVATEAVATEVEPTDTDDTEASAANDTDEGNVELPFVITLDDATEKGALELDTIIIDEITEETEKHSYTFEAAAGQTVLFKVNAEGSAFTSPYGFVYDPDGELVTAIGDISGRATRSYRTEQVLDADGTYTIVIGSNDGNGIEEYAIVVESVESEEPVDTEVETDTAEDEPTPDPVLTDSSLALTMDDATEKGTLELDTAIIDEITEDTEKHSYTFEGIAGQTVLFKVNAEGSAFTSPYGFLYNPDGEYVTAIGDVTARATRSYRIEQTLEADGLYTIVVGPYDGNGVEDYAVIVESIESEEPTTEVEEDDSAAAEPEPTLDPVLTDPSLALTVDDATEKSALELDTPVIDEITEETEKHSYTFEGTAGQTVLFKVNAEGSAFTSPYGFVYNPDGDYVVAIGDVTARATRSYRIEQTLEADGTYTIIVGSYDGNGVEAYAVTVETVESE